MCQEGTRLPIRERALKTHVKRAPGRQQGLKKIRENLENLGTLGLPLGLEILGKTRESLEIVGALWEYL